jgi:hypothetical protein
MTPKFIALVTIGTFLVTGYAATGDTKAQNTQATERHICRALNQPPKLTRALTL